MSSSVLKLQTNLQTKQANTQKDRIGKKTIWKEGMLVYLLAPSAAQLQLGSKKISSTWVGPLFLKELLDSTHCILSSLDGVQLHGIYHCKRLKPAWIRTQDQPISSIEELENHLSGNKKPESLKKVICDENGVQHCSDVEQLKFIGQHEQTDTDLHLQLAEENSNLACCKKLTDKDKKSLLSVIKNSPKSHIWTIVKGRYKVGSMELLLRSDDKSDFDFWLSLDGQRDQSLIHSILKHQVDCENDASLRAIRFTGSSSKFLKKISS